MRIFGFDVEDGAVRLIAESARPRAGAKTACRRVGRKIRVQFCVILDATESRVTSANKEFAKKYGEALKSKPILVWAANTKLTLSSKWVRAR